MPIEIFFTYHLKAHTLSNKLVSIVFAQKKGGTSYDSSNMCSDFGRFRSGPPLNLSSLRIDLRTSIVSFANCCPSAAVIVSCCKLLRLSLCCKMRIPKEMPKKEVESEHLGPNTNNSGLHFIVNLRILDSFQTLRRTS